MATLDEPPRPSKCGCWCGCHADERAQRSRSSEPGCVAAAPSRAAPLACPRALRVALCASTLSVAALVAINVYLSIFLVPSVRSTGLRSVEAPLYSSQQSTAAWRGPVVSGRPASLALGREFDPTASYVANEPLQTSVLVEGQQKKNRSIFHMMGSLSSYAPSPGFGVDEYPMPKDAEISQVHMLSRHGARYPAFDSQVAALGERLANASGVMRTKGDLAFLEKWTYGLGSEMLVAKGRQEMVESGVLHNYMYGHLHEPGSKLFVRTTTQERMLKSAELWLAGFFGLDWSKNASILAMVDERGVNNTLAGFYSCPNVGLKSPFQDALDSVIQVYLVNATSRFQAMTVGFTWTARDVYNAQAMCCYETVAYGFSKFCHLFTYEEWQGFEYAYDVYLSALGSFHSPVGRAMGIGYQQEILARIKGHMLCHPTAQVNITLDCDPNTFPLNQRLYLDFSHDVSMLSMLTAFGFRQFAEELPLAAYPGKHNFTSSHIVPFGARLNIEIIKTPKPVPANRKGYLTGGPTKYVHFVLNQRTLPLGLSFPECDASRKDGWCLLDTFLKVQEDMLARAAYHHSCFGDYPQPAYSTVTDGVPP